MAIVSHNGGRFGEGWHLKYEAKKEDRMSANVNQGVEMAKPLRSG
jgi:hypothetical protein